MSVPAASFVAVVVVLAAYIALVNYLYFRVVLPELQRSGEHASPKGMPSAQFVQIGKVVGILRERNELSWRYYVLKSVLPTSIAWLAVCFLGLAYVLLVQAR